MFGGGILPIEKGVGEEVRLESRGVYGEDIHCLDTVNRELDRLLDIQL